LRYLVSTVVLALICLTGCTSEQPELPFPTTVPSSSSSGPVVGPPLQTASAPTLVKDFSAQGRQPIPSFWGEHYTTVIACTGGGTLQVWDVDLPKAAIYRGPCDGSVVRLPDNRPAMMPVTLWIVADPSAVWTARVEDR